MGYQEKRIWILLTTEFAFYSVYFWALHHHRVHLIETMWIVLGFVIAQVILQSLLAVTGRSQLRDERDMTIENRGFRIAYFVLAAAIVMVIGMDVHHPAFGHAHGETVFVVNTLFAVLGLAELSKLITQATLYRRQA